MSVESMFFDAVESGGVYDREYSAGDFSRYLEQIVGNGVFPTPSTQLQVVATNNGFNIVVKAGQGWVDGHKMILTADYLLTVDAADALLTRIDRVVLYCDYTEREMGLAVKKGTPSATPTPPDLTRNASRFELSLANITITKQLATITNAEIYDTRADSEVCGWVAGLIQQIDTSSLYQQWESAYAQFFASTKTQLDDFMETLTEELRVNTYVTQFRQTVYNADVESGYGFINIDIPGYTYNPSDLIDVYFNGAKGIEGLNYHVYTEGPSGTSGHEITYPCILPVWTQASDNPTVEIVITKSIVGIENLVSRLAYTGDNGDHLIYAPLTD